MRDLRVNRRILQFCVTVCMKWSMANYTNIVETVPGMLCSMQRDNER